MLKFISMGWAHLQFNDKQYPVSYLTDVPIDILEALVLVVCDNKDAVVELNGESHGEYLLVMTDYPIYLIVKDENGPYVECMSYDIKKIAKSFIEDIENNIDICVDWLPTCSQLTVDEINEKNIFLQERRKNIISLVKRIKQKLD